MKHIDVDPKLLKNHPLQAKIYGDVADMEFCEEIEKNGILQPILITEDWTIISGHRRMQAARKNALATVPCVVSPLKDRLDIEEAFLSSNANRLKTVEQTAREVKERLRIETERAAAREKSGKRPKESDPRETVPQGPADWSGKGEPIFGVRTGSATGRASDIAGEAVGWSGKTAVAAVKVVDAIDDAEAAGDTEKASELRETLNTRGVKPAARKAEAPASDFRDPHGQPCSDELREAFEISHELGACVSQIGKLESRVTDALKGTGGIGDFVVATAVDLLNRAKQHIALHRPWTTCQKCGDKPKKSCAFCKGRGWVDRMNFKGDE